MIDLFVIIISIDTNYYTMYKSATTGLSSIQLMNEDSLIKKFS